MRIWFCSLVLFWSCAAGSASADDELAKQAFLACSQNSDMSACDELVAMPDLSDFVRSNALAVRGMVKFRLGDVAGAQKDLSDALVINPENTDALYAREMIAKTASEQGAPADIDCAGHPTVERRIAACSQLIENSQSDPKRKAVALDLRASAYLDLGKFTEAINDLKQIPRLAPDYDEARQHLIIAYYWSGDYSEALRETEIALKNPGSLSTAELFHYQAALLYLTGRKAQSVEAFREAHARNPMSVVASFWAAIVSLEQGEDAAQSLQKMSGNPMLGGFGMTLASFRLGDTSEAKVLEQANAVPVMARQNALCMAYFNIGHKAWLEGSTEKARQNFAAAIDTGELKLTEYHAARMLLAKL